MKTPSLASLTPPDQYLACGKCGSRMKLYRDGLCWDCSPPELPNREVTLRRAGAPSKFVVTPFDPERSPAVAKALAKAEGWEGGDQLLTFVGPTGTGKSMLSVEVMYREICRRHRPRFPGDTPTRPASWVMARDIPHAIYGEGSVSSWNRLTQTPILVVDELGRGHQGGGWEAVGDVLRHREVDCRATIINTNLTFGDDGEEKGLISLDPSLADRIRGGLLVPMGGESLR